MTHKIPLKAMKNKIESAIDIIKTEKKDITRNQNNTTIKKTSQQSVYQQIFYNYTYK